MVLIIDNYDSFVFNLARYFEIIGHKTKIVRNDQITLDEIENLRPNYIVISPGPGNPTQAGISLEVIRNFFDKIPILGVCLGHQAIGQAFGLKVKRAKRPLHGKASFIAHNGEGIFKNLPNPLTVGRYHSLIVVENNNPYILHNDITVDTSLIHNMTDLVITARSLDDEVMALQHKNFPLFGVQFHPESTLTKYGLDIIKNFISYI